MLFSTRSNRLRQSFRSFSFNCRRPLLPKMADRRFANFSSNCQEIFASPLNFVMPAGIGRKSFVSWKSIAFAGSGPIPARSMNEISRPSNSCRAQPIFFICAYSAITRRSTIATACSFIATINCFGNAKLLWKAGRLKSSGTSPKCVTFGHSSAITSKVSPPKPVSGSPSVWALSCHCLQKPKRLCLNKIDRSSICFGVTKLEGRISKECRNPNDERESPVRISSFVIVSSFVISAASLFPHSSFDLGRAEITLQFFRNSDRAVRLLTILDERCEQSRQRQPGAVQCVAKPVFPLGIFVAEIHPARLEIFKVRTTRNFQVTVLTRRPHLDVVSFR